MIERVGRQARHETVGDPFGQQQLVQQDGVQATVEGGLYRACVFPQSDGRAHLGVVLLVGVGNVAGYEAGQRKSAIPGRGGRIGERVEPEVFADAPCVGRILQVAEAVGEGIGGIFPAIAQQGDAFAVLDVVQSLCQLLVEDEADEQEGDECQREHGKHDPEGDFKGFFHGSGSLFRRQRYEMSCAAANENAVFGAESVTARPPRHFGIA